MRKYIAFACFLIGLSTTALAQNFYSTSGTTVSISSTGSINVKDSLINQGKLINNGNLIVGGTWRNLGEYDAGVGKITFNGSNVFPQIINHNNQSINRLEISGGGQKQILADLTVVESLTLANGIITAENNAGVRFSASATISGGSDAAHINAPVYQTGSGTKLFPIGNGTRYLPVQIEGISENTTTGVAVEESNMQGFSKSASIKQLSASRYWVIDVESGSLEGSKIILPVVGDEGFQVNDKTGVAFSASTTDPFESLGRGSSSTSTNIFSERSPGEGIVTLAMLAEGIVVYNAISPSGSEGMNDYVRIDNIEPEDVISIYNRWGDCVFEMSNYNSDDAAKRFNGQSNKGGTRELPAGTYYYIIKRKAGEPLNGYISVRR